MEKNENMGFIKYGVYSSVWTTSFCPNHVSLKGVVFSAVWCWKLLSVVGLIISQPQFQPPLLLNKAILVVSIVTMFWSSIFLEKCSRSLVLHTAIPTMSTEWIMHKYIYLVTVSTKTYKVIRFVCICFTLCLGGRFSMMWFTNNLVMNTFPPVYCPFKVQSSHTHTSSNVVCMISLGQYD